MASGNNINNCELGKVSFIIFSGFFHDHLFVPEGEEDQVMESLQVLSESLGESSEEESVDEEEVTDSDTNEAKD